MRSGKKIRLSFNAPVVLGFSILCFAALILGAITNGASTTAVFSVYHASFADPLTYVRFFGHVCGHANWEHFIGNLMMLLVIGPLLEEKYGSANILFVILSTALVTGVVHFIFFPHVQLLGASGGVFAFILLSSFASMREGTIPVTFLLVAVIYIGGQIYEGVFVQDHISNLTHILGGGVGSALGYVMTKNNMGRYSSQTSQ